MIGGITNDVLSLAHHLKEDFNIRILYGEKEPDEKEAAYLIHDEESISFCKVPSLKKSINLFRDLKAYNFIFREIRKSGCQIVHTHGSKSGFLGRLAAHKGNIPCIIHTYHGHVFHSYYNRFISGCIIKFERWLATFTTHIIAISDQQGEELVDVYKIVPPEKLSIIHLGVDKLQFCTEMQDPYHLRTKFEFDNDTIAIGMIGRVVAIKNFKLFADIAEGIVSSPIGKQVKFFIVGDGELKQNVQQDLDKRNIRWCNADSYFTGAQVVFTSWISSIGSILNELDIVMLTSRNEGTPFSLIEAQFCGKPVIATDAGGVRDTFVDNETGFLIPQNEIEMFVEKLTLLIDDRTLRETMGRKASVFAAEKFSKEAEAQNIKQLYNNCKTVATV